MNLHRLLQQRAEAGKPVRVGIIGAGKFGTMFLSQIRRTAGMHLVGWLPSEVDDRKVSRKAALKGVDAQALSVYSLCGRTRPGLMLGYTCFTDDEIREGVCRLARALQ